MFSIVIPLYNKKEQINDAVNSILAQSVADFELIIVDDGSTDGSSDVVANVHDSRIRYFRQKNAGVSAARNKAIELACGQYICFLDADDIWLPNHLECLQELLIRYPNAGLYATLWRCVSSEYNTFIPKFPSAQEYQFDDIFKYELKKNTVLLHTNSICIPKEIINKFGGFEVGERIGEDTSLWYRIASEYPVAISNNITTEYRMQFSDAISTQGALNKNWSFIKYYSTIIRNSNNISLEKKQNIEKFIGRYYQSVVRHDLLSGDKTSARKYLKRISKKSVCLKEYLITILCFFIPTKMLNILYNRRTRK